MQVWCRKLWGSNPSFQDGFQIGPWLLKREHDEIEYMSLSIIHQQGRIKRFPHAGLRNMYIYIYMKLSFLFSTRELIGAPTRWKKAFTHSIRMNPYKGTNEKASYMYISTCHKTAVTDRVTLWLLPHVPISKQHCRITNSLWMPLRTPDFIDCILSAFSSIRIIISKFPSLLSPDLNWFSFKAQAGLARCVCTWPS